LLHITEVSKVTCDTGSSQICFSEGCHLGYFGQIYCPSSGVSTLYTQQYLSVMLIILTVY